MVERRAHSRCLTLKTGKVVAATGESGIDCAILDISDGGACILVGNPAEVPQSFALTVDSTNAVYRCDRVWTTGHKIGLTFLSKSGGARHD